MSNLPPSVPANEANAMTFSDYDWESAVTTPGETAAEFFARANARTAGQTPEETLAEMRAAHDRTLVLAASVAAVGAESENERKRTRDNGQEEVRPPPATRGEAPYVPQPYHPAIPTSAFQDLGPRAAGNTPPTPPVADVIDVDNEEANKENVPPAGSDSPDPEEPPTQPSSEYATTTDGETIGSQDTDETDDDDSSDDDDSDASTYAGDIHAFNGIHLQRWTKFAEKWIAWSYDMATLQIVQAITRMKMPVGTSEADIHKYFRWLRDENIHYVCDALAPFSTLADEAFKQLRAVVQLGVNVTVPSLALEYARLPWPSRPPNREEILRHVHMPVTLCSVTQMQRVTAYEVRILLDEQRSDRMSTVHPGEYRERTVAQYWE